MPTNRRILSQDAAVAAGDPNADQNLVVRIDANDEDSIESGGANTGAAGTTIFDIANHDLNVPLIDKGTDLVLHLNASDTTSYSGSGTTWTDLSSDGNNGTITGATFGSDTRGYFTFDGTNDEVEVGADTDLSNNANNFSAEVWFNADSVSGTEYIFYQNNGTAGATHQFIIWRSSANVYIYIYGSSNTTLESLGGFTQGEWTHVAFTFDGSNVKGYVNGTLKQTTARTDNANTSTDGEIYLGSNGTTNFFTGKIAVARYYKTPLTASEVAQNFRANCFLSYSSIYSTNLQMHLDAGDDTTVSASTWSDKANSNNGTLTGFSSTLSDFYDKELGNWLEFDGTDDKVTNSDCNLDSANISITAWVWLDHYGTGDGTSIVHLGTPSTAGTSILFRERSNGKLSVYDNGAANLDTDNVELSLSTWHYVALTVSGTTYKLYVDGIEKKSGTETAYSGDDRLIIGNYNNVSSGSASQFWDGKMGVVKLYNVALTPAQVAQNYLATKNDYPNGHNGTLTSVSLQTGTPSYIDFTAGASGDYIDLGSTIPFPTQFSITHWLNFHEFSTASQHLSSYYGGGNLYYFSISGSAGKLDFNVYGTGTTTQISGGDTQNILLNTTEWQLVTATCDFNGTIKIYIDKTLSASKTNNATAPNTKTASDELYIGGLNNSPTYSMGADLGAFRFYDKELTSAEIDAIFDAEKATYGRS